MDRAEAGERPAAPVSKVVGLYQMFLRRQPGALLPRRGPRDRRATGASSSWTAGVAGRITGSSDDPDGLGRGDRVVPDPLPVPARAARPRSCPSERRLIEVIVRVLDLRFRALFDPEAVAAGRDVPVRPRRLHRHRVPRHRPTRPGPRGAGGAAGRGALDLREPPGLDRRPAAGDGRRPGAARPDEPAGGAPVQRPPDRDQGVPPALRRRPDVFLVDRQGDLARAVGHRPLGRAGPGRRAAGRAPARAPTSTTPGRPATAGTSAWC